MSEDAPVTTTTPQTHAAWTPEGEVKPPAPKVSEDAVVAAISSVYDPEIPVDIYQLGIVLWAAHVYAHKERKLDQLHHLLIPVVPGLAPSAS